MHLAFATTLRLGEICGLTWNNIDVSAEAIKAGKAYLYVDKQLQRINTGTYKVLMNDEVSFVFPDLVDKNHTTTLVLKSPKTSSSVRKVFIPETVALLLVRQYARIQEDKKMQGSNYNDYNLVFCWSNGNPIEGKVIQKLFEKLIKENGLRRVVFHSLRHTSITYKLIKTNGDIKAVQGDSGHATPSMILNVYSHILDENRAKNASLIENDFYKKNDIVFQNQIIRNTRDEENNGKYKISDDELKNLTDILKSDKVDTLLELLSKLA